LTPFTSWINQFTKEKSDRGILARWFTGANFGIKITKEFLISSMRKQGCQEFLIETLEKCWIEFESLPYARITLKTKSGSGSKNSKIIE